MAGYDISNHVNRCRGKRISEVVIQPNIRSMLPRHVHLGSHKWHWWAVFTCGHVLTEKLTQGGQIQMSFDVPCPTCK